MQQTKTYNLNLLETSDTFSPAPLNENMETLETALASGLADEAAARQAADSALGRRVTALETHGIATGSYAGDGVSPRTIYVGFTPKAVMIQPKSNNGLYMGVAGGSTLYITPVSGGFQPAAIVNRSSDSYSYCAIS